ncbi:C40 family peptidase [Nocardioides caldifontis]|uniref:C40 family peptidase n=1 Tax=Nocardioides caldifontis TaxID=2588938 RepID=UPI0011DF406F|nr:C40 family peptidase [Nocardioides caldifontis]
MRSTEPRAGRAVRRPVPAGSAVAPRGWRRALATLTGLATGLATALALLVTPTALAAPGDGSDDGAGGSDSSVPTRRDVERARERASEAASDVASVQALLARADAELEAASIRAAQAYEAYNGARWELGQAEKALRQARQEARTADRRVAGQRQRLAVLVASTYEGGGGLTTVDAVLGSEGPEGLMSRLLSHEGASSSLDAQYQRFTAVSALADAFRAGAGEALERQRAATEAAEESRRAAEAAAADAQATATAVAAEKDRLVARLAELEGISVKLARKRQQALEEQAREAAALEAEKEARRQARREARREAGSEQPTAPAQDERQGSDPAPDPEPEPDPAPDPAPEPPSAPPPAGGASKVLAFARAQLGEPYVWGAAGPTSWDCSGLTMRAWQQAGVSLPHYSVAQYDATTPISSSDLRPGDLVFWGSSSDPGSIHHVALYLGDGMIIHAPRTGRPVSIDSMYYWVPPNFFGRV